MVEYRKGFLIMLKSICSYGFMLFILFCFTSCAVPNNPNFEDAKGINLEIIENELDEG